ncbi:hypothetical protein SAMN05443572_102858 [Myxococcus fulvus]|uniref:Uncharacterized protein n=1 Tax=Myxococcus fulvus TaxID=33 RepID=A0A511SVU4_MYXFU|nr:hypothetical protein [Myxococcus fulvus]GEN06024.1 hypothetical protein MFU01_10610 [Myxococcus fulvus]SET60504.1 hypothetical protein SAMN05443572_102858 [Myxococcus fulvus]
MTEDERKLRALSARPLVEVLDDLAALQKRELRGEQVRLPRVTLHLRSGRELSGTILALAQLRQDVFVLVRGGAPSRNDAGSDATYVALGSIEALTVHDAAGFVGTLAPEGLSPLAEPAPTRLGARRLMEAQRKELVALLGGELSWEPAIDKTADGEPLRGLVLLANAVAGALKATANAELGREAVKAGIQRVIIEGGGRRLGLEGGILHVSAPLEEDDVPSVETLTTEIETLL